MARNNNPRRRGRRRQRGGAAPRAAAPPRPTRSSAGASRPPDASSDADASPDSDGLNVQAAAEGAAGVASLPARPRRQIQSQAPTTEDTPRVRGWLYRLTHPRAVIGIIDELRKVVWPSRQETANLTVVVLVVSIAIGIFLGAIDFGLNRVVEETLLP